MGKKKENNQELIGHLANALSYMTKDRTIGNVPLIYTVQFLQGYMDRLLLENIDKKNDYFDFAESEKPNIN